MPTQIIAFGRWSHARHVTILEFLSQWQSYTGKSLCRQTSSDFEFVAHNLCLRMLATPLRTPIAEGTFFSPMKTAGKSSHFAAERAASRQCNRGSRTVRTAKSDTSVMHSNSQNTRKLVQQREGYVHLRIDVLGQPAFT